MAFYNVKEWKISSVLVQGEENCFIKKKCIPIEVSNFSN